MQMGPWADEIKAIQRSAEHVTDALPALHAWLHETGIREDDPRRRLPERVQACLALLNEELDRVGRTGVALFRRLCTDPVATLLRGDAVTWEEYRILQAMGLPLATAKTAGLSPVDDFELLGLLQVEDGPRRTTVNPALSPGPSGEGPAGLRFGIPPEAVGLDALRPDQREFFQRHWPALHARFRRD